MSGQTGYDPSSLSCHVPFDTVEEGGTDINRTQTVPGQSLPVPLANITRKLRAGNGPRQHLEAFDAAPTGPGRALVSIRAGQLVAFF